MVVILAVANVGVGWVLGFLGTSLMALLINNIVSFTVSLLISMGTMKITLDFVDGKKGDYKDLYQQYPLLLKYIGASLLEGLIVVVGFIFLIIPGIYLAVKLNFASYAVIDKKVGPVEALKSSYEITNGNWWNLFLLGVVSVLITLAGALALLVGLFVAIPVVMLAYAYVYRKLASGVSSAPAVATTTTPTASATPDPAAPAAPAMPQS